MLEEIHFILHVVNGNHMIKYNYAYSNKNLKYNYSYTFTNTIFEKITIE